MKKKIFSVLLCTTMLMCSATGCGVDDNLSVDSTFEQSKSIEYKTIEPPEDGWTVEKLFSVSYLCGNQLSYPLTADHLAGGLKLDMENAVYMKNILTDLFYNDDYLGVCIFVADENDVPESIQTITVDNIHSEISQNIIVNGINIGSTIDELKRSLGTPSEIGEKHKTYFVKYFDKNDDTKGVFFTMDTNDIVIGITLEA